jgi:hypothetical protein
MDSRSNQDMAGGESPVYQHNTLNTLLQQYFQYLLQTLNLFFMHARCILPHMSELFMDLSRKCGTGDYIL